MVGTARPGAGQGAGVLDQEALRRRAIQCRSLPAVAGDNHRVPCTLDLTKQQTSELRAAAAAAAVLPVQQTVISVVCRLASVDPGDRAEDDTASP